MKVFLLWISFDVEVNGERKPFFVKDILIVLHKNNLETKKKKATEGKCK